jgi:hypothetical protein
MTAARLLDYLSDQGVSFKVQAGRLVYDAPVGVMAPVLSEVRRFRNELIELLNPQRVRRVEPRPRPTLRPVAASEPKCVDDRASSGTSSPLDGLSAGASEEAVELARVQRGWSPTRWRRHLLQLAQSCEWLCPERANALRHAANLITEPDDASSSVGIKPRLYPRPDGGFETFVERAERYRAEHGGLTPGACYAKQPG